MHGEKALAVASIAVFGLALGASVRLWKHPPAPTREPLRLPYGLKSISQRSVAPGLPPEATWSYLAKTLCGGEDLFADLMYAAERGLDEEGASRKRLPPLLKSARVKKALACGQAIAATYPPDVVAFDISFDKRWLTWLPVPKPDAALRGVPPKATSPNLKLLRCTNNDACTARVAESNQWLSGSLEDLRAFAAALPDGHLHTPEQGRLLAALDAKGAESTRASSDGSEFLTLLWAYLRFAPMPLPERGALDAALKEHVDVWSVTQRPGSTFQFVLVAHDKAGAIGVEKALGDYLALVRQSPQLRRPHLDHIVTQWREPALFEAAQNRARARAWQTAKLTRHEDRVTLEANTRVTGEDRIVESYLAWRKSREADAAHIVDSLAAGGEPGEAELRAIGGQYLLDLMRGAETEPPEKPYRVPTTQTPPPASGAYYSLDDLEAQGITIQALDARRTLLCGFDQDTCVCLEPLECGRGGSCPRRDENIEAFERALAGKNPGRSVVCEAAETGHCGELSYFDFRGDIHRYELRWFDTAGRLIAQRNFTDYPEYCDGRANARWLGTIPQCSKPERDRVLCGKPRREPATPVDDLLRTLGL